MSEHGQSAGQSAAAGPGGMVNTGLSISGSTVSAGVIAGGQGARATVNQAGAADDRTAQIERLIEQLQAAASKLGNEEVKDDAGRLQAELGQHKPDRERITQLLGRIARAAAPFAPLVEIVVQLTSLIV